MNYTSENPSIRDILYQIHILNIGHHNSLSISLSHILSNYLFAIMSNMNLANLLEIIANVVYNLIFEFDKNIPLFLKVGINSIQSLQMNPTSINTRPRHHNFFKNNPIHHESTFHYISLLICQ